MCQSNYLYHLLHIGKLELKVRHFINIKIFIFSFSNKKKTIIIKKICDFNKTKVLDTIDIKSPITLLRFQKKNELLAISSDDLCIRVIDVDTRKIVREFWGHKNRITDLVKTFLILFF